MTTQLRHETCAVCATPHLERNNFYFGKSMTVRDFFAEQRYFNQKRWLLNRSVFGSGVAHGLGVRPDGTRIWVDPGLALDCCGREILICDPECLDLPTIDPAVESAERRPAPPPTAAQQAPSQQAQQVEGDQDAVESRLRRVRYLLCARYEECLTEPTRIPSPTCDVEHEHNRIRDGYTLTLERSDLDTGEVPQFDGHLQTLRCNHHDEHCASGRLHDQLGEHLASVDLDCSSTCCVPLAVVVGEYDDDGSPVRVTDDPIQADDAPRLVYRNPLLFDLVESYHGDLPRIHHVSWPHDKTPQRISWNDFKELIDWRDAGVPGGPQVCFDRRMDDATLDWHSFQVAVITRQRGTGYGHRWLVPGTVNTNYDAATGCSTATFVAEKDWLEDEMEGHSELRYGAHVEITLRGSLILDSEGRALDGDAIDWPSGNGTPGGDFVSALAVEERP